MHDASPKVRAAAAQALRRVPEADVDRALAQLGTDVHPAVRSSAVDAISERAPTVTGIQTISNLATGDPVFSVRAEAVQLAGHWVESVPELADVLRSVTANDQSESIRKMAAKALARLER